MRNAKVTHALMFIGGVLAIPLSKAVIRVVMHHRPLTVSEDWLARKFDEGKREEHRHDPEASSRD